MSFILIGGLAIPVVGTSGLGCGGRGRSDLRATGTLWTGTFGTLGAVGTLTNGPQSWT